MTESMVEAGVAALRRHMRDGTPVQDYDGRVLRAIVRGVIEEALRAR